MKSKASLKGHPIHPILITFPVAFFGGAFIFDMLGLFSNPDLYLVGKNLCIAGIVSALLAAVPGIIDYFGVIPPESSAKKRGAKHGVLNILITLLFTFIYYYRTNTETPSPVLVTALEFIGLVGLSFSGWMGGTLVYKNQIGVDNRYASSGKWKEEHISVQNGRADVGTTAELKTDQMKLVHVEGKRIVIGRNQDGFVAFDDRCTHKGGSLAGGMLICGTVQCPWHGTQFDTKTGAVKAGPASDKISTYKITEQNGRLILSLN